MSEPPSPPPVPPLVPIVGVQVIVAIFFTCVCLVAAKKIHASRRDLIAAPSTLQAAGTRWCTALAGPNNMSGQYRRNSGPRGAPTSSSASFRRLAPRDRPESCHPAVQRAAVVVEF